MERGREGANQPTTEWVSPVASHIVFCHAKLVVVQVVITTTLRNGGDGRDGQIDMT